MCSGQRNSSFSVWSEIMSIISSCKSSGTVSTSAKEIQYNISNSVQAQLSWSPEIHRFLQALQMFPDLQEKHCRGSAFLKGESDKTCSHLLALQTVLHLFERICLKKTLRDKEWLTNCCLKFLAWKNWIVYCTATVL